MGMDEQWLVYYTRIPNKLKQVAAVLADLQPEAGRRQHLHWHRGIRSALHFASRDGQPAAGEAG